MQARDGAFFLSRDASSNSIIAFGKFFIDAKDADIGSVFSTYFFQVSPISRSVEHNEFKTCSLEVRE